MLYLMLLLLIHDMHRILLLAIDPESHLRLAQGGWLLLWQFLLSLADGDLPW